MQPARLGAGLWCLLAITAGANLFLESTSSAQTNLETQQQANERIRQLSNSSAAPTRDYVIGRGDLLAVEVFDIPELSRDLRVSQSGTVGIPLVPVRLYVAGLTEMQTQQKIAEVLEANGLISNPQVMVSVKEKKSKPITIVGAVQHPMVYQADRQVTLVQVLAEAGGISADAGDTVIVTRTSTGENAASNSGEPPEIGAEDAIPIANPAASVPPPPPRKIQARRSRLRCPAQQRRAEARQLRHLRRLARVTRHRRSEISSPSICPNCWNVETCRTTSLCKAEIL